MSTIQIIFTTKLNKSEPKSALSTSYHSQFSILIHILSNYPPRQSSRKAILVHRLLTPAPPTTSPSITHPCPPPPVRPLTVSLLIQLHHLAAGVFLRRVQGVQVAGVCPQLLDGAGAERVARGDQHAEPVLDQPETDLGTPGEGGGLDPGSEARSACR